MRSDGSEDVGRQEPDGLAAEARQPDAREAGGPEGHGRHEGVLWKVCGITDEAGADAAVSAGANALGFIFYAASPRGTTPAVAARIAATLPDSVLRVGVFVNASLEEMQTTREQAGLDIIQLSGDETPDLCSRLGGQVWKALRMLPGSSLAEAEALAAPYAEWTLLLDAGAGDRYGGTGEVVDWNTAARLAARHRLVLAGGLRPDNVAEAASKVRPWAVDVASGVEVEPGRKDKLKLRAFAAALRPFRGDSTMTEEPKTSPDVHGRFGSFGGRFVPETLMPALFELEAAHADAMQDSAFRQELDELLADFAGRPTPLYEAHRLAADLGGPRVWLKREDLLHTGAHKINNTIGQALLAQRMGKRRVIAETGAGQHGVATATVAARFGLECTVYMGEEDIQRQRLNVFRMRLLGAEVVPVSSGSRTLKDATNEAIRDWVTNVESTFYILGSVVGPHPYPAMVRDFQSIIGREVREQLAARGEAPPSLLIACVGGGSNAMGLFADWLGDDVEMIGVEAAGYGLDSGEHAASLCRGKVGVLHGARSYLLQTDDGQVKRAHSISAGLDYPGVGPQHAQLRDSGRVNYTAVTDAEAVEALQLLSRREGIIPALESAHAIAELYKRARAGVLPGDARIVVCLSGRGDKDVEAMAEHLREHPNEEIGA
jgi:phosphoribosylanthranilate isomerase